MCSPCDVRPVIRPPIFPSPKIRVKYIGRWTWFSIVLKRWTISKPHFKLLSPR